MLYLFGEHEMEQNGKTGTRVDLGLIVEDNTEIGVDFSGKIAIRLEQLAFTSVTVTTKFALGSRNALPTKSQLLRGLANTQLWACRRLVTG